MRLLKHAARKRPATINLVAVLLLGVSGSPQPAHAEWQPGWTVTPYGWLAGIGGDISTPSDPDDGDTPPLLGTELDGGLEQLGFMFHAAYYDERWMAFADSVWANVSQSGQLTIGPVPTGSRVRATIDGNIHTLAAGYRLTDWSDASLAVYLGARHYDIDTRVDIAENLLPEPITSSASLDWTDAVIGLRWSQRLSARWHLAAHADVGFGDSDTSGQVAATIAYRFSRTSIIAGYRYLVLDAGSGDSAVDLSMFGPLVGIGFRF